MISYRTCAKCKRFTEGESHRRTKAGGYGPRIWTCGKCAWQTELSDNRKRTWSGV